MLHKVKRVVDINVYVIILHEYNMISYVRFIAHQKEIGFIGKFYKIVPVLLTWHLTSHVTFFKRFCQKKICVIVHDMKTDMYDYFNPKNQEFYHGVYIS